MRHYGEFYGIAAAPRDDDRPVAVVHGNCQAESLRVLLAGAPGAPMRTVRIPPVHELTVDDLPHLGRLLGRSSLLLSQPVRPDYRQLPLGVTQLAAMMPDGGSVVRYPVIRYAGLYPFQVIVRVPGVGDPPVAPYHDLRTLLQVATGKRPTHQPCAAAFRAVAEWSVDQLRLREVAHDTVTVHDVLTGAGTHAGHTINHPGNVVLLALAHRVQEALGWPVTARDPGRTLLDSVHTPREPAVLAALDLPAASAREGWTLGGRTLTDDDVVQGQLPWYATHPEVVPAALRRHAVQLDLLGIS